MAPLELASGLNGRPDATERAPIMSSTASGMERIAAGGFLDSPCWDFLQASVHWRIVRTDVVQRWYEQERTHRAACLRRGPRCHRASRLMVVDALDDAAASFYRHYDFTPVKGNPRRLALKIADIGNLLG